jgi:hypothetical protein
MPKPFTNAQIDERALQAMAELGFELRDVPWATWTGSRLLTRSDCYDCHFTGMQQFCMLIGDYESLVILDDYCPDNSVSMSVKTLTAFLKYRNYDAGQVVTDIDHKTPLRDANGEILLAVGGWNDPSRVVHFSAGINALHTGRGQVDTYWEPCDKCIELHTADPANTGCKHHKGKVSYIYVWICILKLFMC